MMDEGTFFVLGFLVQTLTKRFDMVITPAMCFVLLRYSGYLAWFSQVFIDHKTSPARDRGDKK